MHSKLFFLLLVLFSGLFAKRVTVYEYSFSTEYSKLKRDYYTGIIEGLYFNYMGSDPSGGDGDLGQWGIKDISFSYTYAMGNVYALSEKYDFLPMVKINASNKRLIYNWNEYWSINGHFVRFRTKSLLLGFQPALEYVLMNKSLQKLSFKPEVGISYTNMSGSLGWRELMILRSGVTFAVYKDISKTGKKNKDKGLFFSLGVLFSQVVRGNRDYGMVYGEQLGLFIDRRQYYPKHEVTILLTIGFRDYLAKGRKVK